MKTNIKDVTPVNLNVVKSFVIATQYKPTHVYSILTDSIKLLKAAKELAEIVTSLNPEAGELGEGKCRQMQEIAVKILEKMYE